MVVLSATEVDNVGCEGESLEIPCDSFVFDCVNSNLLFMTPKVKFMTLVLTMLSIWL